jgi:hypothetical protein
MEATRLHRGSFAAAIILRLYGCLYALFGVMCLVFPFILRPRPGDHVSRGIAIGIICLVVGAVVAWGWRWATVLFCLCSVSLGIFAIHGILSLATHPPLSVFVGYAIFTFLPVALALLGWSSLK